jgi:hypothetical protein
MLEDSEAGKLIKHLLKYVNDLHPVMEDRLLKIAFQPMKLQLKRDLSKYDEVLKKRIESGKKGGKITQSKAKQALARSAKANQASGKQVKANQADNVNDTVTVIVNDTVNEKKEREENSRALLFLKTEYPQRFETDFLMKYKSKIQNPKKFAEDFNDTVDQESLEFTDRILFGRLGKYARNWIENQNKYSKTPAPDSYESGKHKRF